MSDYVDKSREREINNRWIKRGEGRGKGEGVCEEGHINRQVQFINTQIKRARERERERESVCERHTDRERERERERKERERERPGCTTLNEIGNSDWHMHLFLVCELIGGWGRSVFRF